MILDPWADDSMTSSTPDFLIPALSFKSFHVFLFTRVIAFSLRRDIYGAATTYCF